MPTPIYLANDRFYAELTQEYTPGDTNLYMDIVPDNVPTILVAGKGTSNETIFTCTNKTANSVTGVARLKGSNVELLAQTPITCLNNQEFINQYRSYIGIAWKGEWDNTVAYNIQDGVSYNNTSYVALQAGTNHLPTDTAYWQVVGVQGIQGVQGNPGTNGADGLGVPAGGTTNQYLRKKTNTDNDTEWASFPLDDFITVADGATITFNLGTTDKKLKFITTLAGAGRNLALSNGVVGQVFLIAIGQDATGSRTYNWFTTIRWVDGEVPTPTTTANKIDVFGFVCIATNTYLGFVVGQNL